MAFIVFSMGLSEIDVRTPPNFYMVGWRSILLDRSPEGDLSRALVLTGQYLVNPFGIFGTQALVVAKTVWTNIGLTIGGLFCDILIATGFLARDPQAVQIALSRFTTPARRRRCRE
ncbi:MAG: hypothetical protein FJW24_08095 [Acidimicrobiia bacterium]|nr:hypothetical protein [Acidimicrobiia bacterium]